MKKNSLLAVTLSGGLAGSAMATPSLLLQYSFNEGTGSTAYDSAANPANGTLVGGTSYTSNTPSGSGFALSNDGTDGSYVTAGDAAKLDGLSNFTLTTWVNIQSGTANNDRIMSKRGTSGSFFDFYISSTDSSGIYLTLALYDGTGAADSRTTYIGKISGKWVFLAVTRAADNTINFYLGDAVATVTSKGGGNLTYPQDATLPGNSAAFMVGNAETNTTRAPVAYFDDVRVYDGVADQPFLDGVRLENVPEPATASLLLLPVLATLARRRK